MRLSPLAASSLLLAAVLPVSIAATNTALALMSAALLWRMTHGGARPVLTRWRNEPAVWGLLAYGAAGLVAAAFGTDLAHSLHDDAKDFHKLWALLLFLGAFVEGSPAALPSAVAAGFAVVVGVGLAQAAAAVHAHLPGYPLDRPHAFVHPVTYGEQLSLFALGGICALLRPSDAARTPAARRALTALLALTMVVLAFNQTRATLFALGAGALALFAFDAGFRRRAPWIAGGLLALAVAWEFFPVGDRRSLFRLLTDLNPANSQNVRYTLWGVAWRMFRDHPWTGVGPSHYGTLFTAYFQGTLDNQAVWSSAHDLVLHQLAERGLVGLAGLTAALVALGRGAWSAVRRETSARALWAFSAFAAFLVMNLTEVAFQNEQLTTLLLFIWAWGTSQPRRADEFL